MSKYDLFLNADLQRKLTAQAVAIGIDPEVVLEWAHNVEINHAMLVNIASDDAILAAGEFKTHEVPFEASFSLTEKGMAAGERLAREAGYKP